MVSFAGTDKDVDEPNTNTMATVDRRRITKQELDLILRQILIEIGKGVEQIQDPS